MENTSNNLSAYTIEFPDGAKAQCSQVRNLQNHDYFDSLTPLNPSQTDCETNGRYLMVMENVQFHFTPERYYFAYGQKPFNHKGTIIISANNTETANVPTMHYTKFTLTNAKAENAVQPDSSDETKYDRIEISFEKVLNEQVSV